MPNRHTNFSQFTLARWKLTGRHPIQILAERGPGDGPTELPEAWPRLLEVIAAALRDCDPQEAGVETKASHIAMALDLAGLIRRA